jgi:hypothetical protein
MEKVNAPKEYGRPRVLVEKGNEPDNDFHRDGFDPAELWPFIDQALELGRAMEETDLRVDHA